MHNTIAGCMNGSITHEEKSIFSDLYTGLFSTHSWKRGFIPINLVVLVYMQWFKRWAVGIEAFWLISGMLFHIFWFDQIPFSQPAGSFQQIVWMFTTIETQVVLISNILYLFFPYNHPIGLVPNPQKVSSNFRRVPLLLWEGFIRAEGWGNNLSFTPWEEKSHGTYKQIIHFETGTWFQPLISQGCTQLCLRVQVSINMHLWFSYHSRSSRWRSPLPKFPVAIASKGLCDKPRLMGVAGQPSTFQVV